MKNVPATTALDATIDALLAAALRGKAADWPEVLDQGPVLKKTASRISAHGVSALLAEIPLKERGWPDAIDQVIREEARLQALWEASHHSALSPVLEAAHDSGIAALVMKGSALAYSLYDEPAHRRRGDTDVLVRPTDLNSMRQVLRRSGFKRFGGSGLLQEVWSHTCTSGFSHEVDLHWAVSGSPAIAQAFPLDSFFEGVIALPALSQTARAPSLPNQMLQNCVNRLSHCLVGMAEKGAETSSVAAAGIRLVWTYDCHLIAGALKENQWISLRELAIETRLAGTLASGLRSASQQLGTQVPMGIIEDLEKHAAMDIAQAYYTTLSPQDRFASDLAASIGLVAKWRVVWTHVMATPELLRAQYPHAESQPLWLLRIRRLQTIAWRYASGKSRVADK